jgi:hypothetical protein
MKNRRKAAVFLYRSMGPVRIQALYPADAPNAPSGMIGGDYP